MTTAPVAQPVPAPLADHVQDHRAGVQRRVQQGAEPALAQHLQALAARPSMPGLPVSSQIAWASSTARRRMKSAARNSPKVLCRNSNATEPGG